MYEILRLKHGFSTFKKLYGATLTTNDNAHRNHVIVKI